MPKDVEDLVKKLLADPKFYPKLKGDKRKARAYAVAMDTLHPKKKKKKDSENLFDGEMLFQIQESAIMFAKDVPETGFHGVKPNDLNSLMILAIAQTESVKNSWFFGKYIVLEECYTKGLPALQKDPNDIVYSDHRYNAENNIGLTRKFIYPNQVVLEIYRGENRDKGNIVSQGIVDKRIRAVSTSFNVLEQMCGICGEIGKPHILCKHYPGETYDGVENIIKIKKAEYSEISTTSRGLDDGAIIIHYNSISRLFQDASGNRFINESSEQSFQEKIIGDPTKLSEQHDKLIEENAQLKEQTKANNNKIEEIMTQLTEMQKDIIAKDAENESLKTANTDLSEKVEKVKKEKRGELINKAFELRKACGFVSEQAKVQDFAYLETQNEKQLKYIINQAQTFIKINKVKPKKDKKTPSIPTAPTFGTEQFKDAPTDPQIAAMQKAMGHMAAVVTPWHERKRSGGGVGFFPIRSRIPPQDAPKEVED